jgi:hypothetical protein
LFIDFLADAVDAIVRLAQAVADAIFVRFPRWLLRTAESIALSCVELAGRLVRFFGRLLVQLSLLPGRVIALVRLIGRRMSDLVHAVVRHVQQTLSAMARALTPVVEWLERHLRQALSLVSDTLAWTLAVVFIPFYMLWRLSRGASRRRS